MVVEWGVGGANICANHDLSEKIRANFFQAVLEEEEGRAFVKPLLPIILLPSISRVIKKLTMMTQINTFADRLKDIVGCLDWR
jgi:hypothetical protein